MHEDRPLNGKLRAILMSFDRGVTVDSQLSELHQQQRYSVKKKQKIKIRSSVPVQWIPTLHTSAHKIFCLLESEEVTWS